MAEEVNMDDINQVWDRILRIKTTGRDDSISDFTRYPYEPTDYPVLARLCERGYIGKNNTLVDYGCGKGRVDFFVAFHTKCHAIGIEYNPRLYERALQNRKQASSGNRTEFILGDAVDFLVTPAVDRAFFFNPFCTDILCQVLDNLRESCKRYPRNMLLFFYYPSASYVEMLKMREEIEFLEEIDCSDLFPHNGREYILVIKMHVE